MRPECLRWWLANVESTLHLSGHAGSSCWLANVDCTLHLGSALPASCCSVTPARVPAVVAGLRISNEEYRPHLGSALPAMRAA